MYHEPPKPWKIRVLATWRLGFGFPGYIYISSTFPITNLRGDQPPKPYSERPWIRGLLSPWLSLNNPLIIRPYFSFLGGWLWGCAPCFLHDINLFVWNTWYKLVNLHESIVYTLCVAPLPAAVTTWIITFLLGNPYKPSFATVTGRGPLLIYTIV